MIQEVKALLARNAETILEDAIGATALLVLLLVVLNLTPAI